MLVGAAVGEDVAALDVAGAEPVVAHGDPITLATAGLGRYAVLVNANDIATSGGEPRWLLATVLLPAGTTGVAGARAARASWPMRPPPRASTLAGGHTEVTGAVSRPLVAATMLGIVRRAGPARQARRRGAATTSCSPRRCAVEGTALLAQELGERSVPWA